MLIRTTPVWTGGSSESPRAVGELHIGFSKGMMVEDTSDGRPEEAGRKKEAEKTSCSEKGAMGREGCKGNPSIWLYHVAVEKGSQPAGGSLSRLRAGAPAKAWSSLAESKRPLEG